MNKYVKTPEGNVHMLSLTMNAGYIIVAHKKSPSGKDIVFGFHPETHQYVTWEYHGASGYDYGHYGSDFIKAAEDFKRRCKR